MNSSWHIIAWVALAVIGVLAIGVLLKMKVINKKNIKWVFASIAVVAVIVGTVFVVTSKKEASLVGTWESPYGIIHLGENNDCYIDASDSVSGTYIYDPTAEPPILQILKNDGSFFCQFTVESLEDDTLVLEDEKDRYVFSKR